ncbi:MAG: protein-ADP-ribose hydrolase [Eubacteriales bacterium]
MSHEEQRRYLIQALLNENPRYRKIEIPANEKEQKDLLRSLFNVRHPEPISDDFIEIQDNYLKAEMESQEIVDIDTLASTDFHERIYLWQGDITTLKVDAIVNAANSALLGCFQPLHNCIDNMIHTRSGVQLRLKCNELMLEQGHEEETGKAKITPGYNLPSKYVLHTVGPIISGKLRERDRKLLADCYNSCLEVALQHEVKSVAFCCISTGVFCFPQREAARIAIQTVSAFLGNNSSDLKVVFNVFTDTDLGIYQEILEC